jgi:hypothetical protein
MASSSAPHADEKGDGPIIAGDIVLSTVEPPDELCCAITHQLFRDPVINSRSQVYERKAIEKWMADNDTDPKTNQVVNDTNLLVCYTTKNLVNKWCRENGVVVDQQRLIRAVAELDLDAFSKMRLLPGQLDELVSGKHERLYFRDDPLLRVLQRCTSVEQLASSKGQRMYRLLMDSVTADNFQIAFDDAAGNYRDDWIRLMVKEPLFAEFKSVADCLNYYGVEGMETNSALLATRRFTKGELLHGVVQSARGNLSVLKQMEAAALEIYGLYIGECRSPINGSTALHNPCGLDVLEYLVGVKGMDVLTKDEAGNLPIYHMRDTKCIQYLVEHGSPVHWASESSPFLHRLLENGAMERFKFVKEWLIPKAGADINIIDPNSQMTLLHAACLDESELRVEKLLAMGADPTVLCSCDRLGYKATALHALAASDSTDAEYKNCVRLVVNASPENVWATDEGYKSPIETPHCNRIFKEEWYKKVKVAREENRMRLDILSKKNAALEEKVVELERRFAFFEEATLKRRSSRKKAEVKEENEANYSLEEMSKYSIDEMLMEPRPQRASKRKAKAISATAAAAAAVTSAKK